MIYGSVAGIIPEHIVTGTLAGTVVPTGSLTATFAVVGTGTIAGSVVPTGTVVGTFTAPTAVTGTLAGSLTPTGSLAGTFSVPSWSPSSLASSVIKGWYKADDAASITSSSGAVSQWNDKSGNGNHVAQATGTLKPTTGTTTLNSKNTLSFDGGDTLNKTTGVSFPDNSTGLTVLAVVKFTSSVSPGWIVFPTNSAASDFSWSFGRNGANSFGIRSYQGSTANQVTFNDNSTATQLLSAIATTTLRQLWQNGTSQGTNTATDSTTHAAGRIYLGSDNNPSTFFAGQIAEIIVLSGTDQTTREKAEGYLAWEWGLQGSLDAGHPYKSAPPTP